MNLSTPKQITWIIAVLIGQAGIAVNQGMFSLGSLTASSLVTIAFIIMAVATWVKGLSSDLHYEEGGQCLPSNTKTLERGDFPESLCLIPAFSPIRKAGSKFWNPLF